MALLQSTYLSASNDIHVYGKWYMVYGKLHALRAFYHKTFNMVRGLAFAWAYHGILVLCKTRLLKGSNGVYCISNDFTAIYM